MMIDYVDRLWLAIKRRKLSIKAISDKSGISVTTISQILLRNNTSPKLTTVQKICKTIGVKIQDIFKEENDIGGGE